MTREVIDDKYEVEVSLGSSVEPPTENADPFNASAADIRKYVGVSDALKKKSYRMSKMHRGVGGAESKKIEIEETGGYSLFEVVLPPYNMDYLAKLYEISAVHKAAVDAKVSNIVGLGFDLVETTATKEKLSGATTEERKSSIARKLQRIKQSLMDEMDSWNEDDTFLETLRKVWTDYETTGNGYLEIGRTNTGKIGYVGHVPSTSLRIRKQRDGFVQMISNKAVFFRNFGDRETVNPIGGDTEPNEIIHFKKYSPTNGFYGIPDIISAKNAVAGNEFAARYNLDYFENKAVPRYVIVIKGATLSKNSEQRILNFFQGKLRGQNHRTLYVPLPADEGDRKVDFKMEPIENNIQDSSFTNYRKANVSDVLMAHRVPISKVSISDGMSLALARDADKTFKEQVCRPEQSVAEKKINKVIKELTDVFAFKLNELTLTDEDTQSKIDERYLRMQTIVPNEVRARKGLPAIEGGDKVVDLKPQQGADARATAGQTRARDAQRSSGATDSAGNARNPQGEGRSTA